MSHFLESMERPFLACLLLAGILVYLGIHVLSRKVIFVDLALAQIAALGSVWGALLGWDIQTDPWQIKAFSLVFTLLGAAVFTLTRMRDERVPHEALIGITYAVALGATMLASAHLAHGAEEVNELLAGSILFVSRETIVLTAVVFAAIGAFHWRFRRQFFQISLDPGGAEARGVSLRLWDFLFYASLGFAVTSAVSIAGVLLVFSYLVIPAVVAMLFADSIRARLAIGWIVGTLVSAIGCSVSYFGDLPSGPTIVACFGAALLLAGIAHYAIVHRGLVRVLTGSVLVAGLVAGSFLLRKHEGHDVVHVLESGSKAERVLALQEVAADPALWSRVQPLVPKLLASRENEVRTDLLGLIEAKKDASLLPSVHALLSDPDDAVRDKALRCVRAIGAQGSVPVLVAAATKEEDDYIKVEIGETLLELGQLSGVPPIFHVLKSGDAAEARKDAWEHLKAHLPLPAELSPTDFAALERWWSENEKRLVPDPSGMFKLGP